MSLYEKTEHYTPGVYAQYELLPLLRAVRKATKKSATSTEEAEAVVALSNMGVEMALNVVAAERDMIHEKIKGAVKFYTDKGAEPVVVILGSSPATYLGVQKGDMYQCLGLNLKVVVYTSRETVITVDMKDEE